MLEGIAAFERGDFTSAITCTFPALQRAAGREGWTEIYVRAVYALLESAKFVADNVLYHQVFATARNIATQRDLPSVLIAARCMSEFTNPAFHACKLDRRATNRWMDSPGVRSSHFLQSLILLARLESAPADTTRARQERISKLRTSLAHAEASGDVFRLIRLKVLKASWSAQETQGERRHKLELQELRQLVHRYGFHGSGAAVERLQLQGSAAVGRNEIMYAENMGVRSACEPITLSKREREVLLLIRRGLTGKEIASELGLAEGTAKYYRKSLYAKLGVHRRSHALAKTSAVT
jgi:DNA-binding CsgD family transcriptional regulator